MNSDFSKDFSSLISCLPIAVFVADDQGKVVFCSQSWLEAIGLKEGEDLSINKLDAAGSIISHKITPIWKDVFTLGYSDSPTISVLNQFTGKKTHFKLSTSLFQDWYAIFSVVDITDQIALQNVLQDKKSQFLSLIDSLGDMVLKLNASGTIIKAWAGSLSNLPCGITSLEGTNLSDHFPEEIVSHSLASVQSDNFENSPSEREFSLEWEGQDRYFLIKVVPKPIAESKVWEDIIIIIRDITEERKTEQEVDNKNRLIKQLTEIKNAPLLHRIEGDAFYFNFISGNLSSLTGYSDQELSKMDWLDLIHPDDRASVVKGLSELRSSGTTSHRNLTYRIYTREGEIRWASNDISKADGGNGRNSLFGVIHNVTEIQLLNEKLRQRDRILTNISKVAMIGGWEYDVKNNTYNLTDELYQIYEREKSAFDVQGTSLYYLKDDQSLVQQHIDGLLESGEKFDEELQLITGKGLKKWVRLIGNAEWQNGELSHVYGIIKDIDEKKKKDLILQENERLFNAAFELAPLGIGLLSKDGKWLKANTSLSYFFELSEKELMDTSIQDLNLSNEEDKPFKWDWIVQNNRQSFQLEKKYVTKSEKVKWGKVNISSVKRTTHEHSYFIIQVVDITENKNYEENLLLAKQEAEEANKVKSDFLSTMTHEIRTPLFGVIGITHHLMEEIHDLKHRAQLKALKFSSDSLLLLVNDILDFSKLKSGMLSLESKAFNLEQLVVSIEELNFPKAKESNNSLVVHYDKNLSKTYVGDELRLGQILNNLVSNAVKFTSNGRIEISIEKAGKLGKKHKILFAVQDNGLGISEDKHEYVFEQFAQAEPAITRQYGGTGLGLPIVKGLLKAMDSRVRLQSKPGVGTRVSFELLLDKPAAADTLIQPHTFKAPQEKKDLQQKTILLVEDNAVSMMIAHDYIKKWNGKVIRALDGLEAIEKFKLHSSQIDLILMDLHLPLLDGYEAAEQIQKISPEVPIIALTAAVEDKERMRQSTPTLKACLIKPFNPEDFYTLLRTYTQ